MPSTFLLRSPQPALRYRPLLTLRPNLAIRTVTPLEPRTPHQPEKLKKLSKNEVVYRDIAFLSQSKITICKPRIFNRVQLVHRHMTGFGAGALGWFFARGLRSAGLPTFGLLQQKRWTLSSRLTVVKIKVESARGKEFASAAIGSIQASDFRRRTSDLGLQTWTSATL